MSKRDVLLRRVLAGNADANIPLNELRNLLLRLGFTERLRGSHHIFVLGATLINRMGNTQNHIKCVRCKRLW